MDQSASERMANLRRAARVVEQALGWEMPVMVEPLVLGDSYDYADKSQLLAESRAANEMGADVLKIGYPGSWDMVADWACRCPVPLVLLSRGSVKSADLILDYVRRALDAGVRGVVMGRNVWQRPLTEGHDLL